MVLLLNLRTHPPRVTHEIKVRPWLNHYGGSRPEIKLDFLAVSHDLVEVTIADFDFGEFWFFVAFFVGDEFAGVPVPGLFVVNVEVGVCQLVEFAFVADVVGDVLVELLKGSLVEEVALERIRLPVQLPGLQSRGMQR